MAKPLSALIACSLVLFGAARAPASCAPGGSGVSGAELVDVEPGVPLELVLDPDDPDPCAYRVRVPRRATALRVRTSGATHDVELYVREGERPDPFAHAFDQVGENVWLDEELLIDVTDAHPLAAGAWYVVVLPAEKLAHLPEDGLVRCTLHVDLVVPAPQPLALGEIGRGVLLRAAGLRCAWRVSLGRDAPARLRVQVVSPQADVNVVVGPPGAHTLSAPFASATTVLAYERLELERDDLGDELVLHVFAYPEYESLDAIPVELLVTSADDPASLCPRPALPPGIAAEPLGLAKAATVAVFGPLGIGSGVVVSEHGHVITNAHVVVGALPGWPPRGEAGRPAVVAEIGVGFHIDPRRLVPPTFGAELVDFRPDLDLALLRVRSSLDLAPLPADVRFPFLGEKRAETRQGDLLYGIGYPETGGTGSLVTITLTRGIHAGFAPESEGVLIKTDAAIHAGISGGACVDELGRLVGFPSSSVSDTNQAGGLGLVIPTDIVPREWRASLGWE